MDGPFMLPGTGPIPGSPGGPAAGAGGFTYPDISSKSYIDRRRKIAQALAEDAMSGKYGQAGWASVASAIVKGLAAGRVNAQADDAEAKRTEAIGEAIKNTTDPARLRQLAIALDDPRLSELATANENTARDNRDFNYKTTRDSVEDTRANAQLNNQTRQIDSEIGSRQHDDKLADDTFAINKERIQAEIDNLKRKGSFRQATPEEQAKGIAGFDGDTGNPIFFPQSAVKIQNTVGGERNKFDDSLDNKEGELWSGYQEQGTIAGGLHGDMEVADELMKMAPQGPIVGRLANAFPGFSSAGAALNSILLRIAPTFRVKGTGSTSDIEYAGMVKSLPNLQNRPDANQIISGVIKAKAAIDIRRAAVVTEYQNSQRTAADRAKARTELNRLNSVSILGPQLRQLIFGKKDQARASDPQPTPTTVMTPGADGTLSAGAAAPPPPAAAAPAPAPQAGVPAPAPTQTPQGEDVNSLRQRTRAAIQNNPALAERLKAAFEAKYGPL